LFLLEDGSPVLAAADTSAWLFSRMNAVKRALARRVVTLLM
jgi:hypothetical protein